MELMKKEDYEAYDTVLPRYVVSITFKKKPKKQGVQANKLYQRSSQGRGKRYNNIGISNTAMFQYKSSLQVYYCNYSIKTRYDKLRYQVQYSYQKLCICNCVLLKIQSFLEIKSHICQQQHTGILELLCKAKPTHLQRQLLFKS